MNTKLKTKMEAKYSNQITDQGFGQYNSELQSLIERQSLDTYQAPSSGRIGRKTRVPTEHEVSDFFDYLDNACVRLYELVEEKVSEFENWNKWFKKEKRRPPTPDKASVYYVREEFNAKRSPHLWKTNPNRKWILSFGNSVINNIVSAILYKYQNETLSKDA